MKKKKKKNLQKMELEFFLLIIATLVGCYVGVFGFVRNVNEWYYVSKLREKKHLVPAGDMGWPLVGNMPSFLRAFKSTDPDTFIYNLVKRYGRAGIYKTHLFWSPSIIVCTPEMCRQVLLDEEQFGEGYVLSTKKLFGNSKTLRSLSDEERKRLLKLTTTPIKGHKALALYIENIEEIVANSLDEWASMHRPIDFLSEMRKVTFKIIAHIFLGSTIDSVVGSMEKHYIDLFFGLKSLAINIPGFAFHRALKARKKLVEILEKVLDEKRAMRRSTDQQKGKRSGLIDLLTEVEDDQNSIKMENEDIIELLLVFLAAGHESSAHATMWAVIYLNQHPELLQKAKEEQEKILKRRPRTQKGLSLEEIKQMEYLAKVINETLRKTSISLTIFRKAKKDVSLQDYIIPKGWKVLVWGRGLHMDPQNFLDPKLFDPSRWDNYVAKAGVFIPFGAGPRFCPGADLAKLEMSIFLHYFLLNYKIEQLNPGCPVQYLPFPRPSDNCLAKVIKLN